MSTNMFDMVVIPDGVIITKYNGNRKKVTIPEELDGYPVVAIDRNAFRGTLVEHVVGKSIKRIGKYAFADTKMLKEVNFPFLEKIDDFAFSKSALKRFFVGPHVSCISVQAFVDSCIERYFVAENNEMYRTEDGSLASGDMLVRFKRGSANAMLNEIKIIGAHAFDGTEVLNISCPNLTMIGAYAFAWTKLKSFLLPPLVKYIGKYAFAHSDLQNVFIPSSVQEIGRYAYANCYSLNSVYIGEGLEEVPGYCFFGDRLLKHVILSYVEKINTNAFAHCRSLCDIDLSHVKQFGTHAFFRSGLTNVDLVSMEVIKSGAFKGCKQINLITLSSKYYEDRFDLFEKYFDVEEVAADDCATFDETPYIRYHRSQIGMEEIA